VTFYKDSLYREGSEISLSSARVIVPLIMQMVNPRSVVDVGCGTGEWLSIFHASGVEEILGIDGGWVPLNQLHIPRTAFTKYDLNKPLKMNRKFDLAISLEVAEHLPASSADHFVQGITSLAPIVLFSAAIPFQGGEGHENEQWPEYWAAIFRKYNFQSIDCMRRQLWSNPKVAHWYSQNCFLAAHRDALGRYPFLRNALDRYGDNLPSLVHPMQYFLKMKQLYETKKTLHSSVRVPPLCR
jgi:SAM-dependent methyltransferase